MATYRSGQADKYKRAVTAMQRALTDEGFNRAASMFEAIAGYEDSEQLAAQCREKALDYRYRRAVSAMDSAMYETDFLNAARMFEKTSGYLDSDELAKQCRADSEFARYYGEYVSRFNTAGVASEYYKLKPLFEELSGFKDADEYAQKCEIKIREDKAESYRLALGFKNKDNIINLQIAASLFEQLGDHSDSVQMAQECRERAAQIKAHRKQTQKKLIITICSIVAVVSLVFTSIFVYKTIRYSHAVSLLENGSYDEAAAEFEKLGDYRDSADKKAEAILTKLKKEGKIIGGQMQGIISASLGCVAGVRPDGTVAATGSNTYGQLEVRDWKNITAVSAGGDDIMVETGNILEPDTQKFFRGLQHTVGLASDGMVVAVGNNEFGQCDVSDWTDIASVSAGGTFTVGLRTDGTVTAVGLNDGGQCNVSHWKDIKAVSAGFDYAVGVRSDGTVITAGKNLSKRCNVNEWTDIVAVSAGSRHTLGLRSDGTVVAAGPDLDMCKLSEWHDIVAVSAGNDFSVGLRSDGTVVAVGENNFGQCEVSDWKGIAAISAGTFFTVGLRADGTVVATTEVFADFTKEVSIAEVFDWKLKIDN